MTPELDELEAVMSIVARNQNEAVYDPDRATTSEEAVRSRSLGKLIPNSTSSAYRKNGRVVSSPKRGVTFTTKPRRRNAS